jgi:hypothetical protein
MVLETLCDQLHRVAASRVFHVFSNTLQRYKNNPKLPNIFSTFFVKNRTFSAPHPATPEP